MADLCGYAETGVFRVALIQIIIYIIYIYNIIYIIHIYLLSNIDIIPSTI